MNRPEPRCVTSSMIRRVMERYPELSYFGLGWIMGRYPATDQDRQDLANAIDEVEAAYRWLLPAGKRRTLNRGVGSYTLKHLAEDDVGRYISNGALICAALLAGFDVEMINSGPNCLFNISRHFVNQCRG